MQPSQMFVKATMRRLLKILDNDIRTQPASLQSCPRLLSPLARSPSTLLSSQPIPERLPRWARINLCRGTEAELLARLTASGFHRHDDAGLKLQAQDYRFDRHIPQLLEFAATADFHDHELVTSGALILQDKVAGTTKGHCADSKGLTGGLPLTFQLGQLHAGNRACTSPRSHVLGRMCCSWQQDLASGRSCGSTGQSHCL